MLTVGIGAATGLAAFSPAMATGPVAAENTQDGCTGAQARYHTEAPWVLEALAVDRANEIATGRGVLVAIVDSGVDAFNPHLIGVVEPGVDLVGDGAKSDGTEDLMGHGTAMAGVIAAQAVEGSGVRGAAPGVRILPVRVLRDTRDESRAAGWGPNIQRTAAGIRYAADQGAKIINVSLSDSDDVPELRKAVEHATAQGSLVVASAGNRATAQEAEGGQAAADGQEIPDGPRYPANYPQVLGVAAVDMALQPSDNSIRGSQVGIAAPGMAVLTTAASGYDCVYSATTASSSFATAYVSAAAALQVEARPDAGPEGWSEHLRVSALRDHPDQRDDILGWGIVRPFEALTLVIDSSVPGATTYQAPEPGALAERSEGQVDSGERTVQMAVAVVGGGAVLWALLWILSVARRPSAAP